MQGYIEDDRHKNKNQINPNEYNKSVVEWNKTKQKYPKKTIQKFFEEHVERYPNQIAVEFYDSSITYKTMNNKANQLARKIRAKGIEADSIVAILMNNSIEMMIGIMAILKAGAAYLPIDPSYPKERTQYILEDSQTTLLLTSFDLVDSVEFEQEVLLLSDDNLYSGDTSNLEPINGWGNLCYVIYTSGSTGKPKGTLIRHYSVARTVTNTNYVEVKKEDRILQVLNYVFDGSVFNIFGTFLNGATLILLKKEDIMSINQLAEIIKNKRVSVFCITSALLNLIISTNLTSLKNVRKIMVGGEALSFEHIKKAFNYLGPAVIVNGYGPTESTVFAACNPVIEINEKLGSIPIGKAISNTILYVVDKDLNPVPIGEKGELLIGGDGLALGYLNNPELTKQKFIENPFIKGEKLYKTGDMVRYLEDGNIDFLGRADSQVKIRGFRIELGEIENKLILHEEIKDAVVSVKQRESDSDGEKFLCAYLVSTHKLNISEIREYLLKHLPEYMIPTFIIQIEKMPLTVNGKIDTSKLPQPNIEIRGDFKLPQDSIEEQLLDIWSTILGLNKNKISTTTDFFELGGHSLSGIRVLSRIQKLFHINLEFKELFNYPSIKLLANLIKTSDKKENDTTKNCLNEKTTALKDDEIQFFESVSNKKYDRIHTYREKTSCLAKESLELKTEFFEKILKVSKKLRVSPDELCIIALIRALKFYLGNENQLVLWDFHSDLNPILKYNGSEPSTKNSSFSIVPVFAKIENSNLTDSIKNIKEQLRDSISKGKRFSLLENSYENLFNQIISKAQIKFSFQNSKNNQGFDLNYLSNNQSLKSNNAFIEIYGLTIDDTLRFDWRFDKKLYKEDSIKELMQLFKKELTLLVEHCLENNISGYTPSDFPLALLNQKQLDELINTYKDIESIYPLSPMQDGILFHSLKSIGEAEKKDIYIFQLSLNIHHKVNIQQFEDALNIIVNRHPILRTSFHWGNGLKQPLQCVRKDAKVFIQHVDFGDLDTTEIESRLKNFAKEDRLKLFNFEKAPLFRVHLISLPNNATKLLISIHHILLDGWSVPILLEEVLDAYNMLQKNAKVSFQDSKSYEDYIAWYHSMELENTKDFWKNYLKGFSEATALPLRNNIEKSKQSDFRELKTVFSNNLYQKLQIKSKEYKITLNTLISGVWALLLHMYSGNLDIIFGMTVSTRPVEPKEFDKMLGICINTVPLRIEIDINNSLKKYFHSIQKNQINLLNYHYTPLSKIQQYSSIKANSQLFDSILVFENFPMDKLYQQNRSLKVSDMSFDAVTNYPITLAITPDDSLSILLSYDCAQFTTASINQLLEQFEILLSNVAQSNDENISDIIRISINQSTKIPEEKNTQDEKAVMNDIMMDLDNLSEEEIEKLLQESE